MPSLRIHFPEKEASSTIVLKGSHVTLGRQPDNTIQILDRTISAKHAELIAEEDGHYRLHDLSSTNGTEVNGEPVTDYHLTEACKVKFGTLECEFSPETSETDENETLPTRTEVETLQKLNRELNGNIDVMRQEIEALKRTTAANGDELVEAFKTELQRVILECGGLRETEHRLMDQITRLKVELALVRRDRENLQGALKASAAEVDRLKGAQTKAAPAASSGAPAPSPSLAPVANANAPAAEAAAAPAPAPVPAPALSKPPQTISPVKPLPLASKPAIPAPSAPSLAPANSVPKPSAPSAPSAPGGPALKPFAPRQPSAGVPVPMARQPVAVAAGNGGPSGTQRIGLVPSGAPAKDGAKPSMPNWPRVAEPQPEPDEES